MTVAYCGYTRIDAGRASRFTESPVQVVQDIQAGYPYYAESGSDDWTMGDGDESLRVAVSAGSTLVLAGQPLEQVSLRSFGMEHPTEETWRAWHDLAREDGFYYEAMRQGR